MLTFPLKKEWLEKIKSGEKTIEYREVKPYWNRRINKEFCTYRMCKENLQADSCAVRVNEILVDCEQGLRRGNFPLPSCKLRLGYTNKYIIANITKIEVVDGKETDLHIDKPVYAIHLANVEVEE